MTVLLPDEPGNAADRLRAAGVDVITMPLHRVRATPHPAHQLRFVVGLRREVVAIRRLIRDRAIDVVQVGGLVNPHAAIAARQEHTPVVWQILDARPPMALRWVMMPLVLRLADMVMTTGRAVADVHPGAAGLGERLVPFYPPVEPEVFSPEHGDRDTARAEFGFAPEDPVLVTVGTSIRRRGTSTCCAPLRAPGAPDRRSRSSSPVRLTRRTAHTSRASTASRASSGSTSAATWCSPAPSPTSGRRSPRPTSSS
jgi:hypothetical protein